tara:strand:+ start:222 stop:437 length:216 start_codon:yes stop_codon:yes gene_type:complete
MEGAYVDVITNGDRTMKIYRPYPNVEYWYDPAYRCWFAIRVDAEGNQVGESKDAHSRDDIKMLASFLGASA